VVEASKIDHGRNSTQPVDGINKYCGKENKNKNNIKQIRVRKTKQRETMIRL